MTDSIRHGGTLEGMKEPSPLVPHAFFIGRHGAYTTNHEEAMENFEELV